MSSKLALAGVFLVSAYAIAMFAPATGIFHDDGIYVVTARALAEGEGYRIISLPESPPQTKYPILFPWLLSLVWRLAPSFPDNLPLLRTVPVASTVAWLWLSWRLLLTCGAPRAAATAVVALTAASPWVVFLGTALLSETLFAALLTGSLLLLAKVREESAPAGQVCALAGLLAGACFLTRTAGIAVVFGGFAWLFVNRRRADAIAFGVAAAALVIPWIGWVLSNAGADADSYYSAANYGSWNVVFHYAWPEKLAVVAKNAVHSIFAPLASGASTSQLWLDHSGCLAGCMRMPRNMAHANAPRHLVCHSLHGDHHAVGMASRTVSCPHAASILMACVGGDSPGTGSNSGGCRHGPYRRRRSRRSLTLVTHAHTRGLMWVRAESAEDWHRLSALLEWIRRETPPDAVLTGNLDPAYFLYTGRKAVRAFVADPYVLFYSANRMTTGPLGSVSDFRRRLLAAGVDYCVWSPAPGFGETPHFRRLLDQLSRDVPGSLTIATGDVSGGVRRLSY